MHVSTTLTLCSARALPSQKNGEKKLRALLCRTREWSDAPSRAAVAAACDASPDAPALAVFSAVMGGRETSAALRKSDLIHLARCWGFKSDLWIRRTGRKRVPLELEKYPEPVFARRADAKAAARAR